jgi:hypothetical protein
MSRPVVVVAVIMAAVAEIAVLLSLPIINILALLFSWRQHMISES